MAARPQLHGNFTPAHADGCGARLLCGVQCASLIILPAYHRPQAATPVLRPSFVAHLFGRGPVLRTCNRVMAHRRPAPRRQIVSVCLMLPEAFFVKERTGQIYAKRKGGRLALLVCLKGQDSPHELCLQPFPQILIYAVIGITAFIPDFSDRQVSYVNFGSAA